ncbi:MAG: hypothetical protein IT372_39640 [Polyangiaceae bacterium]|nr:hypothetical protein [Polyangiaceae bacterium]
MPLNCVVRKATVVRGLSAAVVAAAVLAGGARRAEAQEASDPVSGDGKGIVGGALLGGEVVMLTMGAIGVEKAWPYLVFGGLGAVAGGVGGYFVEDAAPPAEVPLYMLAGGMALVIPTVIVTLNATAYKPPEGDLTEPMQNEPAGEAPLPKGSGTVQITTDAGPRLRKPRLPAAHAERTPAPVPRGLVDLDLGEGRLALGVPAVELRPLYSRQEIFRFGVQQGQEVRFPVVRAAF